jgi:hypothetical protein
MFSSTLKRSVATLGVMTGLLAAAGPASAQFLPTGTGVKAPANAMSADISGKEMADAVKAPASPTSEVFTSVSNVAPLDLMNNWVKARTDAGTQVGSEGVKDNGVPLETVSVTFKGEVTGLEPV